MLVIRIKKKKKHSLEKKDLPLTRNTGIARNIVLHKKQQQQ